MMTSPLLAVNDAAELVTTWPDCLQIVIEAQFARQNVTVPHRQIVFSIPKLIRRCFLFDRKLLADLSRVICETLKEYTSTSLSVNNSMPGCACPIQTFGDFLVFNPHCHIIISDGTFDEQGNFQITPYYDTHALEQLFRHKLLKMLLLAKGAISQWHIDLLMFWQHSGFNVNKQKMQISLLKLSLHSSFVRPPLCIAGIIQLINYSEKRAFCW